MLEIALTDVQVAFAHGHSDIDVAYAGLFECLLEGFFVTGTYLDYYAWILGEENLRDVLLGIVHEVYLQSALRVGEAHFEQSGDEAACADVVSGEQEAMAHALLHGIECIAEIFGILHRGHVGAYASQALCQRTATQMQGVKREVDVVEGALRLCGEHGTHHLADVGYLSAAGDDDGSRRDNLGTVRVFLGHGEAVFARGHINLQLAAEVA